VSILSTELNSTTMLIFVFIPLAVLTNINKIYS